ncbi:MAG: YCF48-related protein [Pyrinomonadaceae bacterium MAG19_C2-C3]|nr:YCF48-related protein [Pyrinomonadaceae bacterium MAG19_C2-C3]
MRHTSLILFSRFAASCVFAACALVSVHAQITDSAAVHPRPTAASAAKTNAAVWRRQPSGSFAWFHAAYFSDSRNGWAAGANGTLFKTTDGGESWRKAALPTMDDVRDVLFFDRDTGWLVCNRSEFNLKTSRDARGYLLKTTDGGESWRRIEITNVNANVRLTRLMFSDASNGIALGESGTLFRTADGGATWQRESVSTKQILIDAAFVAPAHSWFLGIGGYLMRSSDGGATWREQNITSNIADVRLRAVSFPDVMHGWTVGDGGQILHTDNGGKTWQTQVAPTKNNLTDVHFINAREGFAVGELGTTIHTTDGGASWRTIPSGASQRLERLFFLRDATTSGQMRAWAIGFGGTIITLDAGDLSSR